ncbi:hypothetical protein Moror_16703 [Moniliophthora roreri MCA 2997]|uniref:Uncharacterized protein n=1 Tax=Moniliophthora roreri (strain MCA 2997) TaxID=1381753 RepID=V2WLB6_MONRO|nr:hypothetical protein Moror_16703 [Moniliophthora roreri MCA 2997]
MADDSDGKEPLTDTESVASLGGLHFTIGSKLKLASFKSFALTNSLSQQEVDQFCIDLANFISNALQANGIPLPNNRWIQYTGDLEITQFQYLKVNYESYETWQLVTDHLHCNPNFNCSPHYDYCIFNAGD